MNQTWKFIFIAAVLGIIIACQAPKEEAEYTSREPIPTSAALDVAITITEERFSEPPQATTEVEGIPQVIEDWNSPEMLKYKIGARDTLRIKVYVSEQLFDYEVQVTTDGKITLPLIGTLVAFGKLPEELQAEIQEQYLTYYVAPMVQVNVENYNSQRIYVMGVGMKNAEVPLKKRTTLFEIINQLGALGLLQDVDLRGAYLQRGEKIYPVDLKRILEGDLSLNYELFNQDILYVRNLKAMRIFVLGEVMRPGVYSMEVDDNLFFALARAGGPRVTAQMHDVRIIRGGLSNPILLTVDVAPLFRRRAPRNMNMEDMARLRISLDASRRSSMALEKLYLQNEDFIFVPKTALAAWNEIIVQISPTLNFLLTQPVIIARDTLLFEQALQ